MKVGELDFLDFLEAGHPIGGHASWPRLACKQGFILARFAGAFKAHLRVGYISKLWRRKKRRVACVPTTLWIRWILVHALRHCLPSDLINKSLSLFPDHFHSLLFLRTRSKEMMGIFGKRAFTTLSILLFCCSLVRGLGRYNWSTNWACWCICGKFIVKKIRKT